MTEILRKHSGWKRPAARKARQADIARQHWAEKDAATWDANVEEIKERRAARLTPGVETTSERLARKRQAWKAPTE